MKNITEWTDADCDKIEELLAQLSGKHTVPIMAILSLKGERSFGQLKRDLAPISAKVLNDSLIQLKRHGFISNRKEMQGQVQMSYYSVVDKSKFHDVLLTLRNFCQD